MITTKPRKHYDYYCTDCETFLSGNGSMITPYKCECGVWERTRDMDWQLITTKSKEGFRKAVEV